MSDTLSDKFVRLLRVADEAERAIEKLPNDDTRRHMLDMAHGEALNAAHAALGATTAVLHRLQRVAEVHMECTENDRR